MHWAELRSSQYGHPETLQARWDKSVTNAYGSRG